MMGDGKLPQNSWSSEKERSRLFWNMTSCDRCDKMRRFPPYFDRFFPDDEDYEFCCEWNVWDKYISCEAEDGCYTDDPDEVQRNSQQLSRPVQLRKRPGLLLLSLPGTKSLGGPPPGSQDDQDERK